MRVLHIERDDAVARSVELMLRVDDIRSHRTDEAEDGLSLAKRYDVDLVLLEPLGLEISGVEFLRRLRLAKVTTPVLILTNQVGVEAKVQLLDAGADDHLMKPFHRDELVARILAVVRRCRGHAESTIAIGALSLSLDRKLASVDGTPIHLTGKEWAILELLAMRRGAVLTKEAILNALYGGRDEPEMKIIDVFICKLRKKLTAIAGEGFIETVWGRGYRMPAAIAA